MQKIRKLYKKCKLNVKKNVNYAKNMVTFKKNPSEETGCLGNPYFLLTGAKESCFFIHFLILTQSVRQPVVTYHSLCSTYVPYRTPCHAIGHQVLPTHPSHSGKQRISLR